MTDHSPPFFEPDGEADPWTFFGWDVEGAMYWLLVKLLTFYLTGQFGDDY